jgi:hypothetical protein
MPRPSRRQLVRSEQLRAGRDQLDRQRDALESSTNSAQSVRVAGVSNEIRCDRLGPLHEQLHSQRGSGGRHGEHVIRGRGQRLNDKPLLGAQAQHGAARDQHSQPRAFREQVCQHWRRAEHMLEVVKHQEQLALAGAPAAVRGRCVAGAHNQNGPRDRRRDETRVSERREVDEKHPVGKAFGKRAGHCQR